MQINDLMPSTRLSEKSSRGAHFALAILPAWAPNGVVEHEEMDMARRATLKINFRRNKITLTFRGRKVHEARTLRDIYPFMDGWYGLETGATERAHSPRAANS